MTPPASTPGIRSAGTASTPFGTSPSSPRVRAPGAVAGVLEGEAAPSGRERAAAFLELTKPGITAYVLLTATTGYVLAGGPVADLRLPALSAGTALAAGGTNALNQYLERDRDRRMRRTRGRPLPAGKLSPGEGLAFALFIATAGVAILAGAVNPITGLLAGATLVGYAFAYTPLKLRSPLSTLAGAVPGALPILGGWTAATGVVEAGALALFLVLFLWQMPHFLGLGWLLRDDYRRGGFRILAVTDPTGRRTGRRSAAWLLLLVPAAHLPLATGTVSGALYAWASLALGLGYLATGVRMALRPDRKAARAMFLASILYLPALLALLVSARA